MRLTLWLLGTEIIAIEWGEPAPAEEPEDEDEDGSGSSWIWLSHN